MCGLIDREFSSLTFASQQSKAHHKLHGRPVTSLPLILAMCETTVRHNRHGDE